MADAKEELIDYQEEEYDEAEGEYEGEYGEAAGTDGDMQRELEFEDELEKLTKVQQAVEGKINSVSDSIDENSIFVSQLDPSANEEDLVAHFSPCGTIDRVTLMTNKFTGQSKGFAYIRFTDKESVENALKLDDTTFKGKQIKVLPKRQNVPTFILRGGRGGRGRGMGGRFRGGRGGGRFAGGRGSYRGRGRFGSSYRGRGAGYHPSYY